jgi:hypothetical protein
MSAPLLHGFNYGSPIGRSILGSSGTVQTVQGTAYFVYIGQSVGETVVWKYVELYVTTAAVGIQVAELGLFSSPDHPTRAAVTLTKLVATGSVTPFSSVGVKRNLTAFTVPIPALTHLWCGFRCNTAGVPAHSRPQCQSLSNDWGYGVITTQLAAPALTTAGPFTGTLFDPASFNGCPALRTTLD